jgi:hypothetical protein
MKIGNQTIVTPADDPIGYVLDWRHRLARAAVEAGMKDKELRSVLRDKEAVALALHWLQPGKKALPYDRVLAWQGSSTGRLIEAFLLAADSCETAATELDLPVADVVLYGQILFDVRDNQNKVRPAILMRLKAELDGQEDGPDVRLRRVALTGGVAGLRRVLGNGAADQRQGLDELVESELTRRLIVGELRNGDLVRLQATAVARERLRLDREQEKPPTMNQGLELALYLLGRVAPTVVQAKSEPDQVEATSQAIRGRLQAQKAVAATPVSDDPDKGYAAMTALLGSILGRERRSSTA